LKDPREDIIDDAENCYERTTYIWMKRRIIGTTGRKMNLSGGKTEHIGYGREKALREKVPVYTVD